MAPKAENPVHPAAAFSYNKNACLAEGGYGKVYKASNNLPDGPRGTNGKIQMVAVKVCANEGKDPALASTLEREANVNHLLKTVPHPNVLAAFYVHDKDGETVLASELAKGDLEKEATLRGRLMPQAPEKIHGIALQSMAALNHLHKHGFVHCDVKPKNLLRMEDGRICLTDFGITRHFPKGTTTPTPGPPIGTVPYMAPELCEAALARECRPFTKAADLFALGVTLAKLSTGFSPFHGLEEEDAYESIINDKPDLDNKRAPMSPNLRSFLEVLMSKKEEDRYACYNHPYLSDPFGPAADLNSGGMKDLLTRMEHLQQLELEAPLPTRAKSSGVSSIAFSTSSSDALSASTISTAEAAVDVEEAERASAVSLRPEQKPEEQEEQQIPTESDITNEARQQQNQQEPSSLVQKAVLNSSLPIISKSQEVNDAVSSASSGGRSGANGIHVSSNSSIRPVTPPRYNTQVVRMAASIKKGIESTWVEEELARTAEMKPESANPDNSSGQSEMPQKLSPRKTASNTDTSTTNNSPTGGTNPGMPAKEEGSHSDLIAAYRGPSLSMPGHRSDSNTQAAQEPMELRSAEATTVAVATSPNAHSQQGCATATEDPDFLDGIPGTEERFYIAAPQDSDLRLAPLNQSSSATAELAEPAMIGPASTGIAEEVPVIQAEEVQRPDTSSSMAADALVSHQLPANTVNEEGMLVEDESGARQAGPQRKRRMSPGECLYRCYRKGFSILGWALRV